LTVRSIKFELNRFSGTSKSDGLGYQSPHLFTPSSVWVFGHPDRVMISGAPHFSRTILLSTQKPSCSCFAGFLKVKFMGRDEVFEYSFAEDSLPINI
jgi:hypothetical protein